MLIKPTGRADRTLIRAPGDGRMCFHVQIYDIVDCWLNTLALWCFFFFFFFFWQKPHLFQHLKMAPQLPGLVSLCCCVRQEECPVPHKRQVRYLMRGINGEKLGLKCLNVGKILTIYSLCRVKCKLYLRSKTQAERDYEKCHWKNPFWYVVCKMMTIFINSIWCVKVDPFVGKWSKRRQTETLTKRRQTETLTYRNVDRTKLKRRQAKTSTYQNINRPKRRQAETSTDQNVDKPNQTKTSTNQNVDKPNQTKTSKYQNIDGPKALTY